jgi:hypothetical protein
MHYGRDILTWTRSENAANSFHVNTIKDRCQIRDHCQFLGINTRFVTAVVGGDISFGFRSLVGIVRTSAGGHYRHVHHEFAREGLSAEIQGVWLKVSFGSTNPWYLCLHPFCFFRLWFFLFCRFLFDSPFLSVILVLFVCTCMPRMQNFVIVSQFYKHQANGESVTEHLQYFCLSSHTGRHKSVICMK